MDFADLKNDYIFRRIFAADPPLLCSLLNDLLERSGEHTIDSLECLPTWQRPVAVGAKVALLDARCKDLAGRTFLVEIQLVHVSGFIDRYVHSVCKGYVHQRQEADRSIQLTDVVVLSICDFELWPDSQRREQGLPLVPMLSRWQVTERDAGNNSLLQVQYAFLELPKLPLRKPESGAEHWAWLFVHAPKLKEVPPNLHPDPYSEVLQLANKANFTQLQLDAYQKSRDEINQVRELVEESRARGIVKGKRKALLRLLAHAGFALSEQDRARIQHCTDAATLDQWIDNFLEAKSAADVLSCS